MADDGIAPPDFYREFSEYEFKVCAREPGLADKIYRLLKHNPQITVRQAFILLAPVFCEHPGN
jgi:hypothetical protein